jgi:hypothetical protein
MEQFVSITLAILSDDFIKDQAPIIIDFSQVNKKGDICRPFFRTNLTIIPTSPESSQRSPEVLVDRRVW